MKTAFFVSGKGSNMKAILEKCEKLQPAVIITDRVESSKEVVEIAAKYDIPIFSNNLKSKDMVQYGKDRERMEISTLQHFEVELVILAGYVKKIAEHVINTFKGQIVNIHPGPLPKYGGKGMYGSNIHKAVIANKEKYTAINIHFVDGLYDHGPIIQSQVIQINKNSTPESLAASVLKIEHYMYPSVINRILNGDVAFPYKPEIIKYD